MDLDLVASFLTVVDEWHYGRAARALHLSAPAVTKRIQRLERQLGVTLVDRGPEGVVGLTAAGLRFAAAARPVLDHAKKATEAAMREPSRYTVRVGVPSGSDAFLRSIDIAGIERQVRRAFPPARIAYIQIPFPLLSTCLPESQVEVLLTIAPVRHRDVDSVPLPLTSQRMGLVAERHPLAEADTIDAAQFCEQPLLYHPAAPDEWMRPFWFSDIRPRREAQLVETRGSNNGRVQRDTLTGSAPMVTLEPDRASLPQGLRPVTLTGADPVTFYAARRRTDRHPFASAYLELVQALHPRLLTPACTYSRQGFR